MKRGIDKRKRPSPIIIPMKNIGSIIKEDEEAEGALKECLLKQFLIIRQSNRALLFGLSHSSFALHSPAISTNRAKRTSDLHLAATNRFRGRRRTTEHRAGGRSRKKRRSGILHLRGEQKQKKRRRNSRFSMSAKVLEAGFAKLQGEDFEYYMKTYSIVLGRNSKKSTVDVDLAGLGGGMNISRQHARIFYDFDKKLFALEVLGKNGCHVQGMLYQAGDPPINLQSQYLLQIGDKKFYFLLPVRSILKPPSNPTQPMMPPLPVPIVPLVMPAIAPTPIPLPMTSPTCHPLSISQYVQASSVRKRASSKLVSSVSMTTPTVVAPSVIAKADDWLLSPVIKKARTPKKHDAVDIKPSLSWFVAHDVTSYTMANTSARPNIIFNQELKPEVRSEVDGRREALPMQAEEKEVVSAVATVLSDLCGPGEWMPLPNLHMELVEHYRGIWPQTRVRKFLTADEVEGDNRARPWAGLLALLRKYPEHFVINSRMKGKVTSEFVSLVSLLS